MKTYPNQKVIEVTNTIDKGSKKPYLIIHTEYLEAAARELPPVAFKLYLYLASNKDGYRGALSTADFAETYKCDVKSARTAVTTLIEKGYLRQSADKKNLFLFNSKKVKILPTSKVEKKEFYDDDNNRLMLTYEEVLEACGNDQTQADELWGEK